MRQTIERKEETELQNKLSSFYDAFNGVNISSNSSTNFVRTDISYGVFISQPNDSGDQ